MYCVVGLGVTGRALIDYFVSRKISCAGFEELSKGNYEEAVKRFAAKGVKLFFERLPDSVWGECRKFFTSPGVPPTRPWVHEAKKRGIPVTGELEFASQLVDGSILAVTGTNGKSTTVSLLHSILTEGGILSDLRGNIGTPLIAAVGGPPCACHVVEVSSYQLETIEKFHPKVSVMLNITADHLDRYPDMESYAAAKSRIFMNQTRDDFFVYNADDPWCVKIAKLSPAMPVPFSLVNFQEEGGFVDKEDMVVRFKKKARRYPLKDAALLGPHNQENMLAAILTAALVGVNGEAVKKALRFFKSLPHRMENVGSFDGVTFYDDSKGTNVGSVVMSLASFDGRVILILGGRDKGGDYAPLKPLVRGKAKAVIVLGEAAPKISAALSGIKPLYRVATMEEAVKKSFEVAQSGDVVLLSPACSSFDQYRNYAERGEDFRKWAQFFGGRGKT